MKHLLRKRWNQLKQGDSIKLYNDPREWVLEMKTGGASFLVVQPDDQEQHEVNFSTHYEASWVTTPACETGLKEWGPLDEFQAEMFREGWSECERYYGIPLDENDPIKALALAILRGDPQACDAAKDILRC